MREPKMFSLLYYWLPIMALAYFCNAEGIFEDAETSKDYASNTYPLFDLRHTIPGEPEIDYPIFSKVPKTNFQCAGKHEGYYADLETRCQAFRICAHTSINGFGFLCPNGTLFSQKNFVCDWYRKVNCEESEQYYSKNNANRIGSSVDMMEKVRHMMEYPIRAATQALQVKGNIESRSPITHTALHQTLKKQLELAETGLDVSQRNAGQQSSSKQNDYAVREETDTPMKIEPFLQKFDTVNQLQQQQQQLQQLQQQQQLQNTETNITNIKEKSTLNNNGDVYVNNLGELSFDPGVDFIHDNARIIAESQKLINNNNNNIENSTNEMIDELVGGLNDKVELPTKLLVPPEYNKTFNHPQSNDEYFLASNINSYFTEAIVDLPASNPTFQTFTPQRNMTSFRFLSRGFRSQKNQDRKPTYEYVKPKQTLSTSGFLSNELIIDGTYKTGKEFSIKDNNTSSSTDNTKKLKTEEFKNALKNNRTEDSIIITTASTPTKTDRYYLNTSSNMSRNLDLNFLNTPEPKLEEKILTPTSNTPTLFDFSNFQGYSNAVGEAYTTKRTKIQLTNEGTKSIASNDTVPPPSRIFLPPENELHLEDEKDAQTPSTVVDEGKLHVENQAATLLLAGVKLTAHNIKREKENTLTDTMETTYGESSSFIINVDDDMTNDLASSGDIVTTTQPMQSKTTIGTTVQPETRTSVIASLSEAGNLQEQIRTYRRFSSHQRSSARSQTVENSAEKIKSTTKSSIFNKASTTTTPSSTTQSYLKRVAANRLRIERLKAVNSQAATNVSTTEEQKNTNKSNNSLQTTKKVTTRNIDKEEGNIGSNGERNDAQGNSLINNKRRYLTNEKSEKDKSSTHTRQDVRRRSQASRKFSSDQTKTLSPQRGLTRRLVVRRRSRLTNFKSTDGTRTATTFTTTSTPVKTTTPSTPSSTTASDAHSVSTNTENYSYRSQSSNNHHHLLNSTISKPITYPTSTSSNLEATVIASQSDSILSKYSSPTAVNVTNFDAATSPSPTSSTSPSSISFSSDSSIIAPDASSTILDFTKLTRAIVDESVLQNFRSQQSNRLQPIPAARSSSLLGNNNDATNLLPHRNEYDKLSPQAPADLTQPPRPEYLPQLTALNQHTSPAPPIVVATAEGRRLTPQSATSVISSLISQQPSVAATGTSYVPLDDFLTTKFGTPAAAKSLKNYKQQPMPTYTTNSRQQQHQQSHYKSSVYEQREQEQYQAQTQNYLSQQIKYQQQQIEQLQHQQIKQQQEKQQTQYYNYPFSKPTITFRQPQYQQYSPNKIHIIPQAQAFTQISPWQQKDQQFVQQSQNNQNSQQKYSYLPPTQIKHRLHETPSSHYYFSQQQSAQKTSNTQHINQQRHQHSFYEPNHFQLPEQHKLLQFPTFGTSSFLTSQRLPLEQSSSIILPRSEHDAHSNIKLPTFSSGILPAPTMSTPIAQRRVDIADYTESEFSDDQQDARIGSLFYSGKSSYDVPLSSIGRLPNDITHLLRRRIRRVK